MASTQIRQRMFPNATSYFNKKLTCLEIINHSLYLLCYISKCFGHGRSDALDHRRNIACKMSKSSSAERMCAAKVCAHELLAVANASSWKTQLKP
jgi:hypothetical protein